MLQYCRLTVKASGIQKSTNLSALVSLIHTKSVQQHISKAVNKSLSLKKDTSPNLGFILYADVKVDDACEVLRQGTILALRTE